MNFKITWEVDDGYAGGKRPHTTHFDPARYFDYFDLPSDEMLEETIQDIVDAEFHERITAHADTSRVDFDAIREYIASTNPGDEE